jgi:hypothetical protein
MNIISSQVKLVSIKTNETFYSNLSADQNILLNFLNLNLTLIYQNHSSRSSNQMLDIWDWKIQRSDRNLTIKRETRIINEEKYASINDEAQKIHQY